MFNMRHQTTERLEVIVTQPGQVHELLNEAEAVLRQAAMTHRCGGIMVTRHDPARYTLELSDTVPFGQTWEQTLSLPSIDGLTARLSPGEK